MLAAMDAAERKNILSRYLDHSRRFDEVAARRNGREETAEVIPLQQPMRELEQEPTMREIEVLQLISDGDGEVARPSSARQAPGAQPRARGRYGLPPRFDLIASRHRALGARSSTTSTAC